MRFDRDRALGHVRVLAGRIGPRLTTSPAFREAAAYVERRLARAGYDVSRQRFGVPAGDSWGVPVAAGTSLNVVATPPGFDPGAPHLLVGAHLDTVAVAPGAEDNASGVAVLLELARLASSEGTRLPTALVAFGGEEPRGPGDALHHFGSRAYVRGMSAAERRGLRGMVSLDRVGVGGRVPVCTGAAQRAAGARRPARRGPAARHPDRLVRGEHVQRPLVVREGGPRGRAARQHAVRRLPLGRRRPARSSAATSSAGSAGSHLGLAPIRLNCQNRSRLARARSGGTTRGAKSAPIT